MFGGGTRGLEGEVAQKSGLGAVLVAGGVGLLKKASSIIYRLFLEDKEIERHNEKWLILG